jgi:predicted metal-dependent enzyme (double-stranded beta helix superfamily)
MYIGEKLGTFAGGLSLISGDPVVSLEQFIADCRAARAQEKSYRPVPEVVARAVADPAAVLRALGEPSHGGADKLYHAPDLTILNVIWPRRFTVMPHNHNMWAVIYTGREDNIFWRRVGGGRIEAAVAKALSERDAEPLGEDIIHSVINPISRLSGAIHVYGGDLFGAPRSEWDPETLLEQPGDLARTLRLLEEANAADARA